MILKVHPFATFESFESDLLAGSTLFPFNYIHHQFIIKVHMGCSALVCNAHFPLMLYHCMNQKKAGFTHSCVLFTLGWIRVFQPTPIHCNDAPWMSPSPSVKSVSPQINV